MSTLQENLNAIKLDKDTNLKPENLKAGVTCLGVTGTYEGSGGGTVEGVKLFETVEEMRADTTAQEGDLAIVYGSEMKNATVDSKFQVATFPNTVVLDTAITGNVNVAYRAVDSSKMFDCFGSLNSSGFSIDCYTESSSIRIQYTSSDGITYTRTDTTGNPVDFGTEIYYENAEMWNDAIGKFIQIGGSAFKGLFKYTGSNWSLAPTQLSVTPDYVYEKEFYGKNGVEIGTLAQDISNSFTDINAEVYGKIQTYYDNLEPRVLTDDDKAIDTSIYCIPIKKDGTPLLDTSNVTNMQSMFDNHKNLITISLLDTSNVTSMYNMFHYCTSLTSIPLLNTSSVTTMAYMFRGCTNLTSIPLLDTSKVTNMEYMFSGCKNLTIIPSLNTSSVTTMTYMFYGCTSLTSISLLDTSKVTNTAYMFRGCTSLTSIPLLDTSSVTTMTYMFSDCKNLTSISLLDTSKVTNMVYMFYGCTNLTDESLNNILTMCANATSYTGTKTLKNLGLTSEQATKCQSLSNYSAFTAAGWTTGY